MKGARGAGRGPDGGGGGADVLAVPDVAGAIRRDWPRLLLRAAVCVLVPLFTTRLIVAFDLVAQLQGIVPIVAFLQPGAEGYGPRVVAFLVLVLVLGALALPRRAGQALLGLATFAILAVAFNHSRLQWTRLWVFGFDSFSETPPSAAAWGWALALLGTVALYVLADEALDVRRRQAARRLPDDETRAVARVAAKGVALALAGGALLAGALLGLGALLAPAVSGSLPRLNPVLALVGLAALLALAVVLAARRATPTEGAPPGEGPAALRVPVRGPPLPPPPPPPPRP